MSSQDRSGERAAESPRDIYPVLPLRDIVVFPHMIVPLFVGRDKSVRALEEVMAGDKHILLLTQKDPREDDPSPDDLHTVGTIGTVMQLLKLPDGTVKVLVEGGSRARVDSFVETEQVFRAAVEEIEEETSNPQELEALARTVVQQFEQYARLGKNVNPEDLVSIQEITQPGKLVDTITSRLNLKIPDKQQLLELADVTARFERVYSLLESEIDVLQVEKRIRNRVKRQMEKTQREYYLNEQMKAIQKELGEIEEGRDELAELEEKINNTKLSAEAKEKATAELKKLRSMSPMSAEATVVRNYLEWMLSIPWGKKSKIKKDLKAAQKVLDRDHYGLDKVKERILEYLAVQQRTDKVRGPILCLVGPPGVGKTSLGKSIAESTGRNFVRISLGGVRDEAEIRGHRRTYIGSMPGKIIQGMKKAKTVNPLFLLDEVDKMGSDFRGDPSSALLEVLDPEQNNTFADHYLEVDYDLSDVMFLCTANSLRMPQPLLDRMEVIRLSGYTEDEKVEIARRHLLTKQMEMNGLKKGEFTVSDDAIRHLIRYYTREAGVRNLERELANLCRKAIKDILMRNLKRVRVTPRTLEEYAGVRRFRYGEAEEEDLIGVTTGLAWTEVGGELLSIEAVRTPGKGTVTMTGKLGDVMKESIQAAEMFIKSRSPDLGLAPKQIARTNVHVHVPEGATPKDGPSAGVAMVTSIVSVLTGIPVRKNVAMTGEITLRGRVLPIGGLKEKLLAAHRGGITSVLIPKDNERDLPEIPDNVKRGLAITPVATVAEVLSQALIRPLTPVPWPQDEDVDLPPTAVDDSDRSDALRH